MKFIKKEALLIGISLIVTALVAFGLSFWFPDLTAKSLLEISAVLLILLYVLLRIGSFLLKVLLLVAILAALFYFLR